MRLSDLTCYRFKNHFETAVSLTGRTAVCGPNGSWKSNLLEALYFVVNAAMPPGRNFRELASGFSGAFFVRLGIEGDDGLRREYRVSCDSEKKTTTFALQGEKLTRSKYQSAMPFRTMLFSPIEMNVLYLGPSLRRDFVDEPLSLAFSEFSKLKKEYGTALKNRNSLLKKIALGKAKSEDLSVWDPLFAAKAAEYYRYRMRFVEYVRARIETLSSLLDGRYELSVEYETKLDPADPEGSVMAYLRKNRDRDVILGYTYIGPHLDDFHIAVSLPSGPERSEHYLSRGENKSLLFALKLLSADFLEEFGKKPIVLLFDDLFSELDPHRAALVLERSAPRQFVVTGQRIPESFGERYGMATVELSMDSTNRAE